MDSVHLGGVFITTIEESLHSVMAAASLCVVEFWIFSGRGIVLHLNLVQLLRAMEMVTV